MAEAPAGNGGVQSVERAFDVLEIMATAGNSIALSQLAELSGLPLPTIHRLTRTLVSLGYVRQLPSRQYSLGPKLIRLGESATRLMGSWSRPLLADLVKSTGETANMALLDDTMAVYIAQVPSEHSMRMFTEVGRRVFPHCTGVGKALLSQLDDETVRNIVSRTGMPAQTPFTMTDPDTLLADLELSRHRGYSVDEGEQEIGVRCFSVPVHGAPTPTAISVSGPAARVTLDSADHIVPLLKRVAKELTAQFDDRAALQV
ncbi:IclR family transcriptional regulator [Antrihabitans cavernicola]|uniref:Glycerol operon regulatory protein n=1 Tax=Antrihabitans cavernicola TaxID=2495913 RepID=A0A5A7S6N0_9NOCA|nr:IclR family transcriptional regulator [Spelaeibacter cavernicola]KAA0021780.1 IclR family transcriptional regulator [Spelaeibacter cavernicola]